MGVDSDLSKKRFHSECSGLIRNYRYYEFSYVFVFQHFGKHSDKSHSGCNFPFAGAFVELIKKFLRRRFYRITYHIAFRKIASELLPSFFYIFDLGAVIRRFVKRRPRYILIGDRNIETFLKDHKLIFIKLLLLVGYVAAFACLPKSVSFYSFSEYYGWRIGVFNCGFESGKYLLRVMTPSS